MKSVNDFFLFTLLKTIQFDITMNDGTKSNKIKQTQCAKVNPSNEWVNSREAREILDVSPSTLRNY